MVSKITLSLDDKVISLAKDFAKTNNISLSSVIENYLKKLVSRNDADTDITPLVKSLSGVVKVREGYDERNEVAKYLEEKYK